MFELLENIAEESGEENLVPLCSSLPWPSPWGHWRAFSFL